MQWERELKRLLAAYEAVQKELERKTGGSDGLLRGQQRCL